MTIRDIAKIAGVSASTVSKIINNKDQSISEETKKKVLDIIEEHQYATYQKIRSQISMSPKSIGLLLPNITNFFFATAALGAEDCAMKHGYSVVICNTGEDPVREKKYIDMLIQKNINGFIIFPSGRSIGNAILDLNKNHKPVVLTDRYFETDEISQVYLDNEKGAYLATKYLLDLGHRKIGCITGPSGEHIVKQRIMGYQRAFFQKNVPLDKTLIYEGKFDSKSGERGARYLIEKGVTAIFAHNDEMALGSYRTAAKLDLEIPKDLSVVGFDDIASSTLVYPSLTTVRQPVYAMAYEAASILIAQIEGRSEKKTMISFDPKLMKRDSVKELKNKNRVKPKKIVVVGSLNMDIVIKVPHIPVPGETILSKEVKTFCGGKGANQATAIGKLNGNVSIIGKVGNDAHGMRLRESLRANNVKTNALLADSDYPTGNAYIYVSDEGENNIVVNAGANGTLGIGEIKQFEPLLDSAEYCIAQLEIPIETVEYLAQYCVQKGIKFILNPAPARKLCHDAFAGIYMIIPNETELNQLVMGDGSIEEKAEALLKQGYENVLVTLGEKGSLLLNRQDKKYFPIHKGFKTVDTTSAGDSFIGSLVCMLAEGLEIEEAISYAALAAAITVSRTGAQDSLADRELVDSYYHKTFN